MENGVTMQTTLKRDYRFDNAKAFLILCVVIAHVLENLILHADLSAATGRWLRVTFKSIYVFHMPVFMIISGRFSKSRIDKNDYCAVINKLVIPYVSVQLIMLVFYSVTGYSTVTDFSFFNPLFGLWYLFNIAVYQLITPRLSRHKWILPATVILALAIAFLPQRLFGGFQRLIAYYPFFLFGYYTANKSFDFCKKPLFRIISILAFAGLVIFAKEHMQLLPSSLLTLRRVYLETAETRALGKGLYLLLLAVRYAAGFLFFFFVLGITPTGKNIFSRLGQDSHYIYVLHLFIIIALRALDTRYGILDRFGSGIAAVLLCLAGTVVAFLLTTPFVKKITRPVIAPNFDIKKIIRRICDE